ncbi:MAG: DUF2461 domain-containing protein [Bacteroidetes bacterium]|nr:DUF2461 domain-containing protein [Bacteroidota bacterium]
MKEILSFLADLQRNNNKEWFDAHRKHYDSVKKQMTSVVAGIIEGISAFDPDISGMKPGSAMFRINRDVRFSANKNPYKNNIGAFMSKEGKKSPFAGYYFHIQPGASFIAVGIWMPEASVLNSVRRELHFNHANFRKILKSKHMAPWGEMEGEQLKTSPKGYDADHPAIDLLRYKSFVFTCSFSDKEVNKPDFASTCTKMYKAALPFVKFVNEAIESGLNERG